MFLCGSYARMRKNALIARVIENRSINEKGKIDRRLRAVYTNEVYNLNVLLTRSTFRTRVVVVMNIVQG